MLTSGAPANTFLWSSWVGEHFFRRTSRKAGTMKKNRGMLGKKSPPAPVLTKKIGCSRRGPWLTGVQRLKNYLESTPIPAPVTLGRKSTAAN
jgi:hypothetical protein